MRQKLVVEARKMPKPGKLEDVHAMTGLSVPEVPPYLVRVYQLRNMFSWLMSSEV